MPSPLEIYQEAIDLRGDENLQLVMRAHLYVEQLLFALLVEALPNPNAIDLERLTFPTKLRLAVAMGLIAEEVIPPLTGLNKLRNGFAHKPDHKFTDKDKQDLLNTIPPYVVNVILIDGDGIVLHTRADVPLDRILRILICVVELRRRDFVEHKKSEHEAFLHLRAVLDEQKKARAEKSQDPK